MEQIITTPKGLALKLMASQTAATQYCSFFKRQVIGLLKLHSTPLPHLGQRDWMPNQMQITKFTIKSNPAKCFYSSFTKEAR